MKKFKVFFLFMIILILVSCIFSACNDKKELEVILNTNGGTEDGTTTVIAKNKTSLPEIKKDGYNFKGWFIDEALQIPFKEETIFDNGGNIKLSNEEIKFIFASWEAISFKINYSLNGGVNSPNNPSTYTIEDGVTFHNPSRQGYTFGGWYNNAIFFGEAVSSLQQGAVGDITLYAKWLPYDITYFLNGGTNNLSNVATYDGNTEITLYSPTRAGYVFSGWYDNAQFSGSPKTHIPEGSTRNRDFYAKWALETYTISYNLNGGANNSLNPTSYNITQAVQLRNATKAGYTFKGWRNQSNDATVTDIPQGTIGNIELYAEWEPISYNITYSLYGGVNNESNPETYTIEDEVVFYAPTRTGYTFNRWLDGSNNAVLRINRGSMGNVVVYAQWQVEIYTISYELYSGNNHGSNPNVYNVESNITLRAPTKYGYIFKGWYDNEDFSGDEITAIPLTGITGNITLYAKFLLQNNIIYNLNGGVNNINNINAFTVEDEVQLSAATKTGYNFDGWYAEHDFSGQEIQSISSGTETNVILFAKWLKINYSIEYVVNGGDSVTNPTSYTIEDFLSLNQPTKTGYVFGGWFQSANFSGNPTNTIQVGTYGNLILYAKWTAQNYNIIYNLNGGSNVNNPATYTIEDSITFLNPSRTGFVFEGWYSDSAFTQRVYGIEEGTTGNFEIHARFLQLYSISYTLNGGQNNNNNPTTYTINDSITLYPAAKFGSTFKGWYDNSSFSGQPITSISAGTIGQKVFYAKFLINYTIGYELYQGINSPDNPSVYTIEDQFSFAYPTKNGYQFMGWYNSADFNNEINGITLGSNQNIIVYAKWEIISYSIIYHLEGGINNQNNKHEYTTEQNVTLLAAEKTGYAFKGWYNNSEFSGSPVSSISQGSVGERNLYAKFLYLYSISYELDGGANSINNPIVYTSDLVINLRPASKLGYTFINWRLNGEPISVLEDMSGNITLVAAYEVINYAITYHMDGGSTTSSVTYTINDEVTLQPANKLHFVFIDWYDNELFEGEPVSGIELGSTGSREYYAFYELYPYAINYHLNGGVNNGDNPSSYTIYDEIQLKAPSKNEYKFLGWYNNSQFTGNPVTVIELNSNGNVNLYARWEVQIYTIVYMLYGGVNSPSNITTYTNEQSVQFYAPTRPNYVFDGWYYHDTRGFTNEYLLQNNMFAVSSLEVGTIGNKVLYARWKSDTYTITYVLNGGINNNNNPDVYNRDSQITLYSPSKENNTFLGWYDNSQFNGSRITSIPLGSEGHKTFYAKFSITYNIEYVLNGGTYNNEPSTYTSEDDTIILGQPIRAGFIFMGWYDNADFNGSIYTEIPSGSSSDLVFVAKFLQQYSITYFLNNGLNNQSNPSSYTIEHQFQLLAAERVGYSFEGWYNNQNFTGQPITEIMVGTTGNIVLYAKFLYVNLLSYNLNGGINSPNNPTSFTVEDDYTLEDATRTGYKFDGWYGNANFLGNQIFVVGASSSDVRNLYAKWSIINYSITYALNSGLNNVNNPSSYNVQSAHITLLNASRNNYDFMGWYDNAAFEGSSISMLPSGSTGDRTYYAKWQPTVYNITYVLNGGQNSQLNPLNYTILSPYISLSSPSSSPTKDGAIFVAWYDNPNLSGSPVDGISSGSYGNRTFYAKWNLITYNIIYNLDGGVNSQLNPTTYNVDSQLTLNNAVKGQYTFLGWYDNSSFEGEKVTVITGRTGELNLYARFSLTYFINYALYGGTNSADNPSNYTVLSPAITLSEPVKEHYQFLNWYNNADYTGLPITQIPQGTTGTINLYAKWTPVIYDIIYELNGGTNNLNPIDYTIESGGIIFTAPQKTGFDFDGWYDNENFNGSSISGIPVGSSGEKRFYAKWQLKVYTINYTLNGGTNSPQNLLFYNVESVDVILRSPTRDYYNFEGWYDNEMFNGSAVIIIPTGSVGVRNYYAKWSPIVYNITYHLTGDAINAAANPHAYTYEDTVTLENPTRDYYIFNNWYTNQYFTGAPITTLTERSGHLDLYPRWTPISYNLVYSLNGGINHLDNPSTYNVETNIVLQKASRANYNFMGWFDNSEFTGTPVDRIQNMTGNRVLYAKFLWSYDITYHLNGGINNANNPFNYTIEDTITLYSPTRENHMFMGWYNNPAFEGEAVTEIDEGSVGAKVFYARFMYSYRIIYHLNGGINNIDNPAYYLEDTDITLSQPSRSGYNFLGWYDNPDYIGEPVKILYGSGKKNITLYARWGEWSYYLHYGEYPQTQLTDSNVITNLNSGINSGLILPDSQGYYAYDTSRYARVIASSNINGYLAGQTYYFLVEPIKWRLLVNNSGEAMIISDVILDSMAYNTVYEVGSDKNVWQNSSLRNYLNSSFVLMAFNNNTDQIINTEIATSINPVHNTSSGSAVVNNVSLLSVNDVINFDYGFNSSLSFSDENRKARNSDYALIMGAYNDNGYGMWWLYTPGSSLSYASFVGADGKVYANGNNVTMSGYGVRPVIYLQLYSL